MKRILLFFLIIGVFLKSTILFAQLKGKVIDFESKEPLAFVNIVYNSKNQGVSCNMDGVFVIQDAKNIEFLKFTYMGYESKILKMSEFDIDKFLTVRLKSSPVYLAEINIKAKDNPAHRIIKEAVKNSHLNDPEKLDNFKYISYNKFYATFDRYLAEKADSVQNLRNRVRMDNFYKRKRDSLLRMGYTLEDANREDSLLRIRIDEKRRLKKEDQGVSYNSFADFIASQYIMMFESVAECKFTAPDNRNETILASKMSGLQNPAFGYLSSDIMSFNIYKEMLIINDKIYINPISSGATSRYFFEIIDTTFSESGDTIFSIYFRPGKGKNFDGLKGVLSINSNRYAIESFNAEPNEQVGMVNIKIQHKSAFIQNHWFPVEINNQIIFNTITADIENIKIPALGVGKTYISEIEINKNTNEKARGNEIIMSDLISARTNDYWNKYRPDSLTRREKTTYRVMDSIGKKHNLDLKVEAIETLMRGYFPYGIFDIELNKLLNINEYEITRIGIGGKTNQKVSKYFALGGFVGYGFKDKAFKYGSFVQLTPFRNTEFLLKSGYSNDIYEMGGYKFLNDKSFLPNESYRNMLISRMNTNEQYYVQNQFRIFRYFKIQLSASQNNYTSFAKYFYSEIPEPMQKLNFKTTEGSVSVRFAYKEKFYQFRNSKVPNGCDYPIVFFNYTKGIKDFGGKYEFEKMEAKVNYTFPTKYFGRTYIQVVGGIASGNTPICNLYNGRGSYAQFTIYSDNSFATMRMNEFLSNKFLYVFFKQDLGSLLFKTEKRFPRISLITNYGTGTLNPKYKTAGMILNAPEKGYFESGVLFNNLITQKKIIGYGFGVFYRYGEYTLTIPEDNLAFTLTFNITL